MPIIFVKTHTRIYSILYNFPNSTDLAIIIKQQNENAKFVVGERLTPLVESACGTNWETHGVFVSAYQNLVLHTMDMFNSLQWY